MVVHENVIVFGELWYVVMTFGVEATRLTMSEIVHSNQITHLMSFILITSQIDYFMLVKECKKASQIIITNSMYEVSNILYFFVENVRDCVKIHDVDNV